MAADPRASNTVLRARDLCFRHEKGERPQVNGVSFELRAGRTFGVLGGNECGKTTLAQLVLGNLTAERGELTVLGERPASTAGRVPAWLWLVRALLLLHVLAAAVAAGLDRALLGRAFDAGGGLPALFLTILEVGHRLAQRFGGGAGGAGGGAEAAHSGHAPDAMLARGVAYASSEHDAGQRLPPDATIESVIGANMPIPKAERRAEVLAALRASGFQLLTEAGAPRGDAEAYLSDGLTCGELSGGQKHLIYLLSVLASRPRLLICDEVLCGLDIDRQSSMVGLLQALQLKFGVAILYLTVDLTAFELMAHDGAFMRRGKFIESGAAHAITSTPRLKETSEYIALSRDNEERSRGKNLRNAYMTDQSVFDL